MFGRTPRLVLLLLASQLASGCYCCHRPFFWRYKWHGGCCEPATTCCSAPGFPAGPVAPPHGLTLERVQYGRLPRGPRG